MEYLKITLLALLLCKGVVGVTFTTPSTNPATVSIAEDAASAATAETLAASGSGTLTYSIVSEEGSTTAADWLFEIPTGTATVNLKTAGTLDYETKTTYVLVVKVSDAGDSSTATTTLSISITDANEAPVWPLQLDPACISSSSSTGAAVGQWTATDPDTSSGATNGAVTGYSITAGDTNSQFTAATDGKVTRTAVALDATAQKTYFLTIEATDGAATMDKTVVVYLDNDSLCSAASTLIGRFSMLSVLIFCIYRLM